LQTCGVRSGQVVTLESTVTPGVLRLSPKGLRVSTVPSSAVLSAPFYVDIGRVLLFLCVRPSSRDAGVGVILAPNVGVAFDLTGVGTGVVAGAQLTCRVHTACIRCLELFVCFDQVRS